MTGRIYYSLDNIQPEPYVDFIIFNSFGENKKCEKGQIDTGASITCIPANLINLLMLNPVGEVSVRTFDGDKKQCKKYSANLIINNKLYSNVGVISTNGSNILIGRNIINLWQMTLNGKNCTGKFHLAN